MTRDGGDVRAYLADPDVVKSRTDAELVLSMVLGIERLRILIEPEPEKGEARKPDTRS